MEIRKVAASRPFRAGSGAIYFCRMRTGDNRVASLLSLYERELADRFSSGEVKAIVRSVFNDRLGWDAADIELRRNEALSESELLEVYLPLKRIRSGEPLQYILGRTYFHGLEIEVAPGVLIPRPETEEMIDLILKSGIDPGSIVDIGTGSGCIALALKKSFPGSRVIGIDVSNEALAIAQCNGERLSIDVEWQKGDVLDPTFALPKQIDLIVSNPPYVPRSESRSLSTQVRDHEPHVALFVDDEDPLKFHRAIADHAFRSLSPNGSIWFEGHYFHSCAVADLMDEKGFQDVRLIMDMAGQDRFITARK